MYRKSFRLIFLLFTVGTFRFISMLVNSFTELLLFYCQNNKLAWKWWVYNVCLSFQSFFRISKILSSISFGGRFRTSLLPMCKMVLYCRACLKHWRQKSFSLQLYVFRIAGLVADLRELNHQQCKQCPLAMDRLRYCQMLHYCFYQFHWSRLVIISHNPSKRNTDDQLKTIR